MDFFLAVCSIAYSIMQPAHIYMYILWLVLNSCSCHSLCFVSFMTLWLVHSKHLVLP